MFNGHTMSLITNLNMIGNEINNIDFVTVAAITTSDYPPHPNIYNAAILMPPTEVLMAWADGNQFVMQVEYPRYLMTKDADDMIVALLAALTKKNIILYIPLDEFNIYGQFLLNHLYYQYGIILNFIDTQFTVNPNSIPLIVSKFYMMDLMSFEDYMASYPANVQLPAYVINKMAQEIHPFNHPATFDEYYAYFNQMHLAKAQNKSPIVMATIVDNK